MDTTIENQFEIALNMQEDLKNLQERLQRYAPNTDKEAWNVFEKYNWVYQTTKILEFQNIKWKPFCEENTASGLSTWWIDVPIKAWDIALIHLIPVKDFIYTELPLHNTDEKISSSITMIIHRGSIVDHKCWILDDNGIEKQEEKNISGQLKLKIQSLLTWYFKKYSGILTVTYKDDHIIGVKLKADIKELHHLFPLSTLKKLPALYSRRQWK